MVNTSNYANKLAAARKSMNETKKFSEMMKKGFNHKNLAKRLNAAAAATGGKRRTHRRHRTRKH